MIPGQFEYVRPAGLHDALRLLSEREGEAKVLSGGYSLLPLMKLRLAQPGLLVDIRDIDGLDGIVQAEDDLRIGGRATHRQILEDPAVRSGYPLLVDAAAGIGDPQIRNWGTIGGSCAHADPVGRLAGGPPRHPGHGRLPEPDRRADDRRPRLLHRHVPDRDRADRAAHRGPDPALAPPGRRRLREARAPDRRLRDRRLRGPARGSAPDGRIADVGIGLTAVADAPFAAAAAEDLLRGAEPSEAVFRAAASRRGRRHPTRRPTRMGRRTTSGPWSRR